jgi:hypothetical protein
MNSVLPTLYRDKNPKGWSYPLGAEGVTRLLSDSKRPLDLFFYYRESPSLSHYIEDTLNKLRRLDAYPSTYGYRKVMTLMWVSDKWGVSVFAVKSDEKARVKSILEKVTPKVIDWLNKDRANSWFDGKHRFEVGIKDDFSAVCFWEIHNSDVIGAQFEENV